MVNKIDLIVHKYGFQMTNAAHCLSALVLIEIKYLHTHASTHAQAHSNSYEHNSSLKMNDGGKEEKQADIADGWMDEIHSQ